MSTIETSPFTAHEVAALAPLLTGAPSTFELCASRSSGPIRCMRAGWVDQSAPGRAAVPIDALPIASVTKALFAYTVCIAVEEGTVAYDDVVEHGTPPGVTLADLMAHCSGLPMEGKAPFAKPRQRRIYSNTGIELAALYLEEQSGIDIRTYFDEAVVQPLKLTNTSLRTSPAYGARSTALDLVTFGRELLVPRLVSDVTVALATSPYEPELKGVLPGFGRQNPNLWGLGFEIRGTKRPHWTGSLNSPRTFGHFGQSGAFVWVDPELDLTVSFVGNRRFDTWSIERWPPIADAIIGAMT